MPLDPQAQAIVDAMSQLPPLDFERLSIGDYRNFLAMFPPPDGLGDALDEVIDDALPGADGPLRVRRYRPLGDGPFPVTVFFHGGGFVGCNLDSHDNICRRLAAKAGTLVVSVEYRLAPEHRFPAAADDAVAAVRWLQTHASRWGGDPTRMAVAGDSAGGNLAAVAAQAAREHDLPVCHQLLLYPVIDARCDSASWRENASAAMLSAPMMRWFWRQYLGDAMEAADDPRASPLRCADLKGVPSATVITAEFDPLRDEGEAYARALREAGVAVTARRCEGQFHGFASMLTTLDAARAVVDECAEALRRAFESRSAA